MMLTLYEHPLNERIRNYLKLEQLFSQATDSVECKMSISHHVFFTALFAILDLIERTDVRGDLIKALEKLEQNLLLWSKAPDIDNSALKVTLKLTLSHIAQLKSSPPHWQPLKNDKFLAALKQRFAIQGASSGFDLPQLKYWLNTSQQRQQANVIDWLAKLDHLASALHLVLKFIRQKSVFDTVNTASGFYQDSGDGLQMLRIKVPRDAPYYPTVSGNKLRYSIRFMLPSAESGRCYHNQAVSFQLARC